MGEIYRAVLEQEVSGWKHRVGGFYSRHAAGGEEWTNVLLGSCADLRLSRRIDGERDEVETSLKRLGWIVFVLAVAMGES